MKIQLIGISPARKIHQQNLAELLTDVSCKVHDNRQAIETVAQKKIYTPSFDRHRKEYRVQRFL